MKNMHRYEMQQIIIYLNKQFSGVLFPCENQGVTIYISYNEIFPLLHLFHFCVNNIFTSAVKDYAWPG
jgi:hypothetical protein